MDDEGGVRETGADACAGFGDGGVILRGLIEAGVEPPGAVTRGEDACLEWGDERRAREQGIADGAAGIERGLDARERSPDLPAAEACERLDGFWERGACADELAEFMEEAGLFAGVHRADDACVVRRGQATRAGGPLEFSCCTATRIRETCGPFHAGFA